MTSAHPQIEIGNIETRKTEVSGSNDAGELSVLPLRRRATSCERAFEGLIANRQIVGFVVDPPELIRSVRIIDSNPLEPLVAALTGCSLSEIFEREVCELFVAASDKSASSEKTVQVGHILLQIDVPRSFLITVRRNNSGHAPSRRFCLFVHDVTGPAEVQLPARSARASSFAAMRPSRIDASPTTQISGWGTLLSQAEEIGNLGIWELDARTGKTAWSEQLFRLLGFNVSRGPDEKAYAENVHPEDRGRLREIVTGAIASGEPSECVSRYQLPSRAWRIHRTRALPIRGSGGRPARVVGIVQDITDQTRAEESLHRLSQQLMRARDEERRQLARELHESAGQTLASLKMTLRNLREAIEKDPSTASRLLRNCSDLADEAVREVRTVSYLMHPPLLDEAGLAPALRWYVKGFSERSKIQVEVDVRDDFGRFPEEIETTLFRIVQEALTNVHRYSGSRVARVHLSREAGCVRAEVEDQGCGLARPLQPQGRRHEGVGIAGMRERVSQLNGILEIESAPGRGTTVRAVLPDSCAITDFCHRDRPASRRSA